MPIRVLLADDQAMVRTGFAMILEAQPDIQVVGEAEDGERAIAEARRRHPDVIVMDIRMPKVDGVAATRAVVTQDKNAPRVLVVTTIDIDQYVFDALRAGASGFLLKTAPPEELVRAVRVVASGEALLAPKVTRRLIEEFTRQSPRPSPPPELEELTEREREVLELVARGLSNTEIAERLVVSGGTVKTHVARILMKLHLRDRIQVVVLAYEMGLITPGQTTPGTHP
jgi:DNA-binding NarL/FixJ family response regulator